MANKEVTSLYERAMAIYNEENSIKAVARGLNIAEAKARKIQRFIGKGLSDAEIAAKMEVSTNYINSFRPYTKAVYNLENATDNAIWLRGFREKKSSEEGE